MLAVHSSADLYGSDKSLLEVVRRRPAAQRFTVALPEHGPLVAELQEAGAEVVVGNVGKVQSRMLSPSGLFGAAVEMVQAMRFLGRLHSEHRFDVIYSNSLAVFGGALLAWRRRVPHVWHVRELLAASPRLTTAYRRVVSALADTVIANSDETLQWIAGPRAGSDPRYVRVWNGYDAPTQQPDAAAARRSLGAAPDEVLIVMVGRVNAWKGQGLLVDAFSALRRRYGGAMRLALVGSAFAGQEHFETALREAVDRSGAADAITLQPFRADVESVWAAADIAVVPSTEPEPFGRVAIEAMAFGKPVVAAAHGGLIEIVADGVTGLLVPPRDAEALALALERLVLSPALRAQFGAAAQQRQLDHFSVASYALQVHDRLQATQRQ
ncbi:glycosyltransferase involved in cell wall biosynthesis [Pelomonas saccharophila]|uniref:Glycosyltransferase involved in cell wall biosynthesis n=1 Tax=Roseateles saccharophilus TaxID=304 RepID=A0ABU1YSD9_ROSSA|nr:glycosyltransferase family 4 protein [Roseateles saccharophilus]MDR7271772.1 glycosyltransferase involved in cell wall biosynthesis [Roseateles saccharophilus]